jgi:hypothetical protein
MNIEDMTREEKAEVVKQIVMEDKLLLLNAIDGLKKYELAPMIAMLIVNGSRTSDHIDRMVDIHLLVAGLVSKKNKGIAKLGELGALHDTVDTFNHIISEKSDEPYVMELINHFTCLFEN